ncbi:MAG: TonB family protein [Gemmatimonadaceae bacterium]|nr:TonB family protein [Gemmatimonadaceae bacterium]
MFSTLVASRPARERAGNAAFVSLSLHAALIATAVVATTVREAPRAPAIVRDPIVFIANPQPATTPRVAAPAAATPVETSPVDATPQLPDVNLPSVPAPSAVPIGLPKPGPALTTPGTLIGAAQQPGGAVTGVPGSGTAAPYSADVVEVPARLRPDHPLPRYPDMLRAARVEGFVRVRFVVGTNGRVEPESIEILESSHEAFVASVRRVLPQLRFTPGRVGGAAIRQLVELPFGFALTP